MKWKWLHYDCSRDLVFCHICISALKGGTLKGGTLKRSVGNVKDSAFLFSGFNNWKDATVGFASHEKSMLKGGRTPEVKTPPLTPTLN